MKTYILLDRTGSMQDKWTEVINSINAYVKNLNSGIDIMLATFDNTSYDVIRNCKKSEWKNISEDEIAPRGMTNLYDSVVRMGTYILDDSQDKAVFVIMTDGEENSSRKYTLLEARNLVQTLKDKNYEVLFMGAEFKEIYNVAGSFGVALDKTINVNTHNLNSTMRGLVASGTNSYAAGSAAVSFTDKDKEKAVA